MQAQAQQRTQVAFHFNAPDKLDYACRFIRKALRHEAQVTVVAPLPRLRQLSARLWQQAGTDFLAHALEGDDAQVLACSPVLLVQALPAQGPAQILLNLGSELVPGFERFAKVVEVVSSFDELDRAQARTRWRAYQNAGHAIERHDLVLKG